MIQCHERFHSCLSQQMHCAVDLPLCGEMFHENICWFAPTHQLYVPLHRQLWFNCQEQHKQVLLQLYSSYRTVCSDTTTLHTISHPFTLTETRLNKHAVPAMGSCDTSRK